MSAVNPIAVEWVEDGSCTVLGRVTARDASGAATGVSGEGKWIKQADLSSITCAVFDLSSSTPDTAITTPTITISDVILDTPDTTSVLWVVDDIGHNFRVDLAASNFPTGEHIYRVEFLFTTTGSAKFWAIFEGPAKPVRTS